MSGLRFEWDEAKAAGNEKKHGVSFAEAEAAFCDPFALLIDDPDHSQQEDRFVLLGVGSRLRLLAVVHCYRGREQIIRVISARRATPREQAEYRRRCTP